MNTDEKNRYSSNTFDFDPNFMRKDKNEQAKEDKMFMKGHKRKTEDPLEINYRKGIHHDPFNQPLNDPNRHNKKYNQTLERDGLDINRDESPTNRDLHYKYIPQSHVKSIKDKPSKVSHNKYIDLPGDQKKKVRKEQKNTEIIQPIATQYHGKTSYSNKKS
jgi:hypothetical protein